MVNELLYLTLLMAGFLVGILVSRLFSWFQFQTSREITAKISEIAEADRKKGLDEALALMKSSFASISLDILGKSTDELLKVAKLQLSTERDLGTKDLESTKGQIDSQLAHLHGDLAKMTELIRSMEHQRGTQIGQLTSNLEKASIQTASLVITANSLKDVLNNSQSRGQWGERIAEDILGLAGFIENISYVKQKALESGSRPDFTFFLPRNHIINMDVKFPISNYSKFIETDHPIDKENFRKAFLKDVNLRVREVSDRGYISEAERTVDCVILFIPNEQIFSFIQKEDPEIFDNGIRNKVVCCSPMTLFAVLAVVRQAVDNFALEKSSTEILEHMASFKDQWVKYMDKFDVLGKRIRDTQAEYDSLTSTRRRMLDRSLDKLERLRGHNSEHLSSRDLLMPLSDVQID
jgi:DNA recombination protein RmuC